MGNIHHLQPEAGKEKKEQPLFLVTMVSEQWEHNSITMPRSKIVFFEKNFLSNKANAYLVGSVEHPISKVCSFFAAAKNAVGLALSSWSGYAGNLCLVDDLSRIEFKSNKFGQKYN